MGMEASAAAAALSALGHEPRLNVFRLLVRAGPEGMAAGEIARAAGVVQNTLSNYLSSLAQAGLVISRRAGRSLIYSVDYARIAGLLAFLVEDCCQADPLVCGPALARIGQASDCR
jgi:DNA-binding transcriptional ArsR family regulator